MPLHVNLHHEIQQQEQARRRDPLRVGMLAVLVVAIGFVIYYFWVLERSHGVNSRYGVLEATWSKLEPQSKNAKARQAELDSQIKASDALIKDIEGRFYWAPVLGEILRTVPRDVQLVRVNGETQAGSLLNVVTIAGVSSGVEPRKQAEAVRTVLATKLAAACKHVTSSFKALDDSDQFVMLDGRRLPTASFIMEFQMQIKEAPSPTPAPAHKSKAAPTE